MVEIYDNNTKVQCIYILAILPKFKRGFSSVTLPTAEILSGKNARAFLVYGFLMKSFKKHILKI